MYINKNDIYIVRDMPLSFKMRTKIIINDSLFSRNKYRNVTSLAIKMLLIKVSYMAQDELKVSIL